MWLSVYDATKPSCEKLIENVKKKKVYGDYSIRGT